MIEKGFRLIQGGAAGARQEVADRAAPKSAAEIEYEEKCAFIDSLFRRHRRSLQNYLNRLTRNRDESEEVIQETYLRLVQTGNLDRLEARARNYIFTIATNIVRDRRRYDRARAKDMHVSIEDVDIECDSPMPEQIAEHERIMDIIKACLLELSPRCARVFVLHAVERLTFREIAEILDVSSKTVKRDFGLALEFCRIRLKDVT